LRPLVRSTGLRPTWDPWSGLPAFGLLETPFGIPRTDNRHNPIQQNLQWQNGMQSPPGGRQTERMAPARPGTGRLSTETTRHPGRRKGSRSAKRGIPQQL